MVTKADPLPLPLDNLGSRQRALNKKVNDAIASNVDFTTVKDETELSEIDRFFKIDVAAKSKKIDYIIEMLKSGDTLYAIRALKKSQWLFDDEYSHIINPEYLDTNIFPATSARVKIIILKTVAMRVRREDRAVEFFKYCMKIELPEIAFKCLLFTSESFKLDFMQNYKKPPYNKIVNKKLDYFQFIIGKSITLLEAYLKMKDNYRSTILFKFKYLYPVNNVKYLELCEKYIDSDDCFFMKKFDNQLCNDIMKKHKDRVLAKPRFYIDLIDKDILIENSTIDDVKVYIIACLPPNADIFWASFFLRENSVYINVIPHSETYVFLKKIFCDKYPGDDFEMSKYFYTQHYYQYMTPEEREEWAWNQIKSEKQVLGVGKDYLWYKFINFKEAFEAIKNFVIVTKEAERRKGTIKVLIYSAKNNRELEILFKHYHRRHNNELRPHKEYFLTKVIEHHNVFEFDEACWNAFYTLLLGMELYNILDYNECNRQYKTIALFNHILFEKDMPEGLNEYLLDHFYPYTESDYSYYWGYWDTMNQFFCILKLMPKLTEQKRKFLYNFLFSFYIDRFVEFKNKTLTTEVGKKVDRYFEVIKKLMAIFKPDTKVTAKLEGITWPESTPEVRAVDTSFSGRQLLRQLRKDKALVIDTLLDVKKCFENGPLNIDGFLKKIKIYFPDDVTKTLITLFEDVLTKDDIDQKSVDACVKAIFELGDESEIVEFMKKYAPEKAKIDHDDHQNVIDRQHLRIQKAICKYGCISRPSVPLSIMLLYMKGDYVKYCLHIFNTYPVVLPPSKCIEFVKALVNARVSIQKHALRVAFKCFDALKLKEISLDYWKNTKNVSVRCVIYKGLFNRLVKRNERELYDALKPLTLDLHDTDEKAIFSLTYSNSLSDEYLGDYKESAWTAMSNFKDMQPNIQRKCNLLSSIREQIHLMREEFVSQIVEEHVQSMLRQNRVIIVYSNDAIKDLYIAKWNLTNMYILHFATTKDVIDKYLETTEFIVKKCLEMWYETHDGIFAYHDTCWEFFRNLKSNLHHPNNSQMYENSIPIFERILMIVESNSLLFENYLLRVESKLAIVTRKLVQNYRQSFEKEIKPKVVDEALVKFGQEVGKLVSSMVHDKEYFISYSEIVKDSVSDSIKELLDVILVYVKVSNSDSTKTLMDDFESDEARSNKTLIPFITGLVKFQMVETYLLAIQILPEDCEGCSSNEYQCLVNKIKEFSDMEIQHALYRKLPKYFKPKP